ncbi:HTH-type transcriptional repressor Bm3R1, partial [Klebsiella pneumoniae]
VARPKSEDKKQALLEAATAAFAQSGIAASTSAIARSAGVAEGTLFRYFATKDELLNELYLAIKLRLVRTMIAGLDPDEKRPKENARNIWNSYIDWGVRNPMEHKAIRRMALSERITDETRRQVKESFPELNEMCQLSVKEIFLSEAYRAFGDALFLSLAETTIEFASHDPQRAREIIASALKPCGTPCMRRTPNDAGNTASLRSPYRPDLPVYRTLLALWARVRRV